MENETFEIELCVIWSPSKHCRKHVDSQAQQISLRPISYEFHQAETVYSIEFEVIWFQLSTRIRKSVGSKKKSKSKTKQYKTKTYSGEWFQKDAASMSSFTDFVWTEGRFG